MSQPTQLEQGESTLDLPIVAPMAPTKPQSQRSSEIVKAGSVSDTFLFKSIVHVKVGLAEEDFGVHREPLCNASSYFKAALTGNFEEATTGVVMLGDENPEVFARFATWLYTGKVVSKEEVKASIDNDPFLPIIDLYVFAEKRIIPRLQNHIIDAVLRTLEKQVLIISRSVVGRIWKGTMESSKIRAFVLDYYVRYASLRGPATEYPPEFLAAVAKALYELIRAPTKNLLLDLTPFLKQDFWKLRCERYHVHEPTDAKCEGSM